VSPRACPPDPFSIRRAQLAFLEKTDAKDRWKIDTLMRADNG
jgi:hypothetical protein